MAGEDEIEQSRNQQSDPSMDAKFQQMADAYERGTSSATKQSLIQKVHFALGSHKNFDKYFKPRAVSLGPIHHGKTTAIVLAEKYKLRLAEHFILEAYNYNKNNNTRNPEELHIFKDYKKWLYKKVEEKIGALRECYQEEVVTKELYDDKTLAWMLFVDGCALLTFIRAMAEGNYLLKDLNIKNDLAAFGQQDVFLLENQLPFQLLRLLMCSTNQVVTFTEYINMFIANNIMEEKHDHDLDKTKKLQISSECPHLLHLFRERLVLGAAAASDADTDLPNNNNAVSRTIKIEDGNDDVTKKCKSSNINKQENVNPTFRNIKELKAAGIGVMKSKTASCSSSAIYFTSTFFKATLFLPRIVVDDWTAPKFLNLVAYEMCPDFFNDFEITSYVCFLDSLIDQPEDVKELRDANILHNILGSDDEVATLFNEISTDLVPNDTNYLEVKEKIHKHYNNQWKTWWAQFYHAHFTTPWTWGAFVGAVLGLFLTAMQSWQSIFPNSDDKPCSCCKLCNNH